MIYTVRIQPGPDEESRYAEEQRHKKQQIDGAKWLNRISTVGSVISFLALTGLIWNAAILHQQWEAMRESNIINKSAFIRAYRPYVGINGFSRIFITPANKITQVPTKDSRMMSFSAEIKNFGPVPGTDFRVDWDGFIDGVKMPGTKIPDTTGTIFPEQSVHVSANIKDQVYEDVQKGRKILTVRISVRYTGPEGKERYCVKDQYDPDVISFLFISDGCAD